MPGCESSIHYDSDGGQTTIEASKAPYHENELKLVIFWLKELYQAYGVLQETGWFDSQGKRFLDHLGMYANCCLPKEDRHLCVSSKGKGPTQPGAFFVQWSSDNVEERYADSVIYDKEMKINRVVSEVKSCTDDSQFTSAHNEQMVGLWRSGQVAMLGLEVMHTS